MPRIPRPHSPRPVIPVEDDRCPCEAPNANKHRPGVRPPKGNGSEGPGPGGGGGTAGARARAAALRSDTGKRYLRDPDPLDDDVRGGDQIGGVQERAVTALEGVAVPAGHYTKLVCHGQGSPINVNFEGLKWDACGGGWRMIRRRWPPPAAAAGGGGGARRCTAEYTRRLAPHHTTC